MVSRNLLLLSTLVVASLAGLGSARREGFPWPMPAKYSSSDRLRYLDVAEFAFVVEKFSCDLLEQAFSRYYRFIFSRGVEAYKLHGLDSGKLRELRELRVELENPCEKYPSLESDESYTLVIDGERSELKAKSIWGALRGLETFSQLVHKEEGRLVVRHVKIEDSPRFAWRGVFLDTSKHFLPVKSLLRTLDAMSFNKMNVFHWRIVDSESFPYESYTFPDLSLKGSYNPKTHVYTQVDVARVIEHARLRGIRVVPEFNTPGHMLSWEKGQPGLLTRCNDRLGPLDPSKESNFEFLRKFFGEVSKVFPDAFLHMGGDEISFDCWKNSEKISAFMEKKGFAKDYGKLERYYIERLSKIVEKVNKHKLVWQDIFDNKSMIDNSTIVHVIRGDHVTELLSIVESGKRAIVSSPWHLDRIGYGAMWHGYYDADPLGSSHDPAMLKQVVGGEAYLGGDFVDSTILHSRLWPSASAVAERLWSPRKVGNSNLAVERLEEQRCRMVRRGILASPTNGPGFCEVEAVL